MLNYIEYSTGIEKGETPNDALIANPFAIGDVTNYTGQAVVETLDNTDTPSWTPVLQAWAEDGTELEVVDGKLAAPYSGKIKYLYDNVVIPQTKLPMLKAEMKSIALLAHARRIAVYYSQIAAFQA